MARCCGGVAQAWQSPDGTVTIRSESEEAAEKLRWVLALDDDHSEFLRRVADDPLIGRTAKHLRGLRPCERRRSHRPSSGPSAASSSTGRRDEVSSER